MVGLAKLKLKEPTTVYFGHPSQFWRERQGKEATISPNIDAMKKLSDIVGYDSVHLEKLIINRAGEKVQQLLHLEDIKLLQKREKLQRLLEAEEECYYQEVMARQAMEECGVCKERDSKIRSYDEGIEREKIRECQRALEREKIAKGMKWTREDELLLREHQKMQMVEKNRIEEQERELEMMWHRVLLDDVSRKEHYERMAFEKHQEDMLDRRRAYDEQITSANRKRQEILRAEREKENRRLEKMRRKMVQEHYEAIRKKKAQQQTNKLNYIEGHELKMARVQGERARDWEADQQTIREAMEGLRRERERGRAQMHQLQVEKTVFKDYHDRERKMAAALEEEADRVAQEWKREAESTADELYRAAEMEKIANRQKAAEEYRQHLQELNMQLEREREERSRKMERVRRTAIQELRKKLDSANEELRRQIQYRNCLKEQIRDNQMVMETNMRSVENKQRPFTKKPEMFKDAMENKVDMSPARTSTNPVHPFARLFQKQDSSLSTTSFLRLPCLGNKYC